ncbi:MAG TPA: hypothetical protein DCL44_06325 [Elusimicrobia bacterium]|nr:hypothetical protein [Elusimicrobiota bacterium]
MIKNGKLIIAAAVLFGVADISFATELKSVLSQIDAFQTQAGAPKLAASALSAAPSAATAVKADLGPTISGWKQAALKAADGTGITVDYITATTNKDVIAKTVWVNVYTGDTAAHKIRVVLINYVYVVAGQSPVKEMQQVDLQPNGAGKYSARLNSVVVSEGVYTYGGNRYRQEISVVKDGVWLKDPISNSNNFKFTMTN